MPLFTAFALPRMLQPASRAIVNPEFACLRLVLKMRCWQMRSANLLYVCIINFGSHKRACSLVKDFSGEAELNLYGFCPVRGQIKRFNCLLHRQGLRYEVFYINTLKEH